MKIIVTAGPTIEPIDPVRFISNRSTGYMAYKIAELARRRKHSVTLISGPTKIKPPRVDKFISIQSADHLLKVLRKEIGRADCLVMCAAVSDFRASDVSKKKIKRKGPLLIKLIPNKDILKELSGSKKYKLFVGFSLETENLLQNSYKKLKSKNLDLVVASQLSKIRNPFGNNKLSSYIIDKYRHRIYINNKTKAYIAQVLLDKIEKLWYLESNRRTYAE